MKFNPTFSLLLIIALFSSWDSFGKSDSIYLNVRVLSNHHLKQLSIAPLQGNYKIIGNQIKISELGPKTSCQVTLSGKKLKVKKQGGKPVTVDTLKIICQGTSGIVKVRSGTTERRYDDDLVLCVAQGAIRVINRVELEHYTTGVVLSEGGDAKNLEFFKLQSLISRTYALKNIRKHEQEGYQLCDQVHCQLYYGHTGKNEILDAISSTRGLVILGPDTQLISAAFHSNSGGETTNSENVWSLPAPYLTGVEDTFSMAMPMARWEKKIPKKQWINNLKNKYHFPVDNEIMLDSALQFTQEHRKVNYPGGIPLKALRSDFNLRSTYFDIEDQGDILLLKGRGFGHGVGLSQEGAIRMANYGCTFNEILKFYYKDITIRKVDSTMIPRKK